MSLLGAYCLGLVIAGLSGGRPCARCSLALGVRAAELHVVGDGGRLDHLCHR